MWVFDLSSGAIVEANAAAAETYGYAREELLACTVDDICPLKDLGGPILLNLSQDVTWAGPSVQRRKDGTTFEADIGMIATGEGAHVAAVVIDRDGADEVDAESSPILSEVAQCRGKTLLGRSKTYARLPDSEVVDLLQRDASFEELDTKDLLHDVRDRVRGSADAKDVDVLIYCTCGRIWAKLRALSEALYQLLCNAIQATRKGYPVVVDARESKDGDVLFHIQDTGEGMRPQVLGDLGRHGDGTGVALAWEAIEQHGGLLRFESAPGVGTTATVWFPRMASGGRGLRPDSC
jgi:hypothetical protein